MAERDKDNREPVDLARLEKIDQVCDRFESAWRSGEHPRIEDYLGQVAEDQRGDLVKYLLPIELEYRAKGGEHPDPHEYTHPHSNAHCYTRAKQLSVPVHVHH